MQAIKESAANVAASAKSGIVKTKATVQEKAERVTAHNPTEKEMATERKKERVHQADLLKQEAREQNAAAKMAAKNGQPNSFTATGVAADRRAGQPTGQKVEGTVIESQPIGTAARNTHSS